MAAMRVHGMARSLSVGALKPRPAVRHRKTYDRMAQLFSGGEWRHAGRERTSGSGLCASGAGEDFGFEPCGERADAGPDAGTGNAVFLRGGSGVQFDCRVAIGMGGRAGDCGRRLRSIHRADSHGVGADKQQDCRNGRCPPADWKALRSRWDNLHRVRIAMLVVAVILAALRLAA